MRSSRTVVLGGVGGDAHSVGLTILSRVLIRVGYAVRYLGTQNSLEEICAAARGADAVLVSNMDGHAKHYLRTLPVWRDAMEVGPAGPAPAVWYLGGNPSMTRDEASVEALRALGFTRVFPGFVEAGVVVRLLDGDLAVTAPPYGTARNEAVADLVVVDPVVADPVGPSAPVEAGPSAPVGRVVTGPVVTRPMTRYDVEAQREEVLAQWPTGRSAMDLAANARVLTARRPLSRAQAAADRSTDRPLLHPRCGVGSPAEQRGVFRALRDAGADVLSLQIDSLTRNNSYRDVEMAFKRSEADPNEPLGLNGYPAVNHGVDVLREITEEFRDTPIQVRHSTRDPRLLAEIAFAGGVAAFEGGAVTYNLPYYRDYPPAESVERWRYVDALAGLYHQRFGIVIDREFFGTLTASLVPPCLAITATVLEALLAASQGVKAVTLGYAEQGSRAQDVGAVRAMRRVGRHYLDAHGYADVAVHTVFHQYMGAFPADVDRSLELLRGSVVTAAQSGATRVMLKTFVEASGIPSARENAASIAWVRAALNQTTREQAVCGDGPAGGPKGGPDAAEARAQSRAQAEEELTVAEASAVIDAALSAGGGDVGAAVVEAIGRGLLDVPFSPSRWNAGRAQSVRDCSGAVRFADPGAVPLPPDCLQHHRALVDQRLRFEGRTVEELVEEDVLRVVRGEFDTWPLASWGRKRGEFR